MRRIFLSIITSLALAGVAFAQEKPENKPAAQPAKPAQSTDKPNEKPSDKPGEGGKAVTAATAAGPLDFTMRDIEGKDVPLSKYKGKVVLIVNVASKCGLTPQYEQLQQLHDDYSAKGLAILAFPANNFGNQEPGSNEEIKEFCKSKYKIGFDLFEKVSVKGDDTCELFRYLTSKESNEKLGGEIKWNFTKFLIDRDGKLIDRFEPRVKPDDPKLTKAVAAALAAAKP